MSRKLIVSFVAILGILLIPMYFADKYVLFENVDRSGGGSQMHRFHMEYPTYDEVDTYLSDSTILISHPPNGNAVYYFDKNRTYLVWGYTNKITYGDWSLTSLTKLMKFQNAWRLTPVISFCQVYHEYGEDGAQGDNCYIVEDVNLIFSYMDSHREYRKGNVFGLAKDSPAPFPLTISKISIDGLLEKMPPR